MSKHTKLSAIAAASLCAAALAQPTSFVVDPTIGDEALLAAHARIRDYIKERPSGHAITFIDAADLSIKADFTIPDLKNPKGKEQALQNEFKTIRNWFKDASESNEGPSIGLNLPAIAAKLERLPSKGQGPRVFLIGTPVYRHGSEGDFHFRESAEGELRVPSDRHLELSTNYTPFGTSGFEERLEGFEFLWYTPVKPDDIGTELERENLKRFWSLYLSRQGADTTAYTDDPKQAFAALQEGSLIPFEYQISLGGELAMNTFARSAGTSGHVHNDGLTLRAPEQYDQFLLIDRTNSMKGKGWEAAMRRINMMPDGDRFLVYLYSDYHDDPVAFEYVKSQSPSSLVSSLRAIKLVPGKDKPEAVEVPLNMVRRKIEANMIPHATISIFTDADAKDPADTEDGLDAYVELSKLLDAGHTVKLYTLSDEMDLSWVPSQVEIRSL